MQVRNHWLRLYIFFKKTLVRLVIVHVATLSSHIHSTRPPYVFLMCCISAFHGMMFTAHGIMQNKVLSYRLAATALDVPRHSQFFFLKTVILNLYSLTAAWRARGN
jgi:hypothetical protein